MIMAVHRDVENEEVEKLQQWREILLNTLLSFEIVEADASLHFKNTQLRENAGIDFELVRHSSLSRCMDVINFASRLQLAQKKKKNPSWAKQVSEAYNADLVMSKLSEQVTETWVERALQVNSRMLTKSTAIVSQLLYLDDTYGTNGPLDSIHKLHSLLSKAGTGPGSVKKLEWMIGLICDLFDYGALGADHFTKRELGGRMGEALITKYDLLGELIKWAEEAGVDQAAIQKIKEITESLGTYREACGRSWLPINQQPACPWRAAFPASADIFFGLLDGVVYSTAYDEVIVSWVRSKKALADFMKMSPVCETLEEVTGMIED